MFDGSFKVLRVFQGKLNGVFERALRLFQVFCKGISKVFQGCFKED